jgi:hypothetical protein
MRNGGNSKCIKIKKYVGFKKRGPWNMEGRIRIS